MQTLTLGDYLDETAATIEALQGALLNVADKTCSRRVELLVATLQSQTAELRETIERIGEKQAPAMLRRAVITPPAQKPIGMPSNLDDSRDVTGWLISALNVLIERTHALAKQRLGRATAGVGELHRLLIAQSKRIAIEAHRFEDL